MSWRNVILILTTLACGPTAYVQPALNEPHALLKIRHVVHAHRGPNYAGSTSLGGEIIDEHTLLDAQHVGQDAWVIRIRPQAATYAVGGHSFHYEQRNEQRTRQVPETYSCPQQQCTYNYPSGQQCSTVYNTCTRYRTEYYTERVTVAVDDDACARQISFAPVVGGTYSIQFDYLGGNTCVALCFDESRGERVNCPIVPSR